jgi:hypothetical protein
MYLLTGNCYSLQHLKWDQQCNTILTHCNTIYCSETSLTGEPGSIMWVHPQDANPGRESKWPNHWTSETGYWSEAAGLLQGLPSQQLDRGCDRSLCCEEEEDLQGVKWNRGRSIERSRQLFTLSVLWPSKISWSKSLRGSNIARHRKQENPVPL